MITRRVGIIMNGVTGRMGTNQHLIRSICAIRERGGVVSSGERIMPDPILVGRNPDRLKSLCSHSNAEKWSTDIDGVLRDKDYAVYFDAQTTARRYSAVRAAIATGKHIYCEKPVAESSEQGLDLYKRATETGLKNGVVQNWLWLPGIIKLGRLINMGFFGGILSIQGKFGYFVFPGRHVPAQRPSWNYRKEEGGGIILDMFCHFSYLLESLFGNVEAVSCLGATHIPERVGETGQTYKATAEDAAYAMFELESGVVATINASWCTRVYGDDLFTLQVDGTDGSAVAGLQRCWSQHAGVTPRVSWSPDAAGPVDYRADWTEVPDIQDYDSVFKAQWERFLKHIMHDRPFPSTLLEGAKNILLAEKARESLQERGWVEIPEMSV